MRSEKAFFERMLESAGLQVAHFTYGTETDGQSAHYLERRAE